MSSSLECPTLVSSDEKLMMTEEAAAAEFSTSKLLIDDVISLPIVDDGDILSLVTEYFRMHSEAVAAVAAGAASDKDTSAVLDALKACGPEFMNYVLNDKDRLYDLTMAANYLNIAERLLNLARNAVANLIKGKIRDDEIRRDFPVKKDFTSEEGIGGKANGVSKENEDGCP